MELTGGFLIPAPSGTVWTALNEPDVLRACVPGCDEIVRIDEARYEGRVSAQIGPLKMRFGGRVMLEDLAPPHGYTLVIEAGGGGAGIVKARVSIRMSDAGGMTRLSYNAQCRMDGAIAQLAPELVQAEISGLVDEFFRRLGDRLGDHMTAVAKRLLTGDIDRSILDSAATPPSAGRSAPSSAPASAAAPELLGIAEDLATAVAAGTAPPETLPSEAGPPPSGPALAPTIWIPALVVLVGLLLYAAIRYGA
jgi:carbon monoxide dehydrogenase subunit G